MSLVTTADDLYEVITHSSEFAALSSRKGAALLMWANDQKGARQPEGIPPMLMSAARLLHSLETAINKAAS